MNLFLPSMEGTKLGFMRDILSDKKKAMKQNDIIHLDVPNYPEISVKNMFEDALGDPEVAKFLPSKE